MEREWDGHDKFASCFSIVTASYSMTINDVNDHCYAVTSTLQMCIHKVPPEMCRCHCWFMLSYIFATVFVSYALRQSKRHSHSFHSLLLWSSYAIPPTSPVTRSHPNQFRRKSANLNSFENKCCEYTYGLSAHLPSPSSRRIRMGKSWAQCAHTMWYII